MTSVVAAGTVAGTGAGTGTAVPGQQTPAGLTDRTVWCFVAAGTGLSLLAALVPARNTRAFLFDLLALTAAAAAVQGVARNRPPNRGVWQLFAAALVLFAGGSVFFDLTDRGFARGTGAPLADFLFLTAYPVLAVALLQLTRSHFRRVTAIDSAVVAVALSAVVWQWVITPVLGTATGATAERIMSVAYPIMDILLVVVIVHAVFALPRWTPAAWFLLLGLTMMLVVDAVVARLVAEGTSINGGALGALGALWPIAYFLLAAAALHPSMRELWARRDPGLVGPGRARMIVLGAALFAAPAVIVLDESVEPGAVALAAVAGVAAVLVAWRIARLVSESNRAREILGESESRFRALVQHAADIIAVVSDEGRVLYVSPAVTDIFGSTPDELLDKSFIEFLDGDGVAQAFELHSELVMQPGRPVTTEFKVWNGESWRWIEATWTNQLAEPAVRGIVGNLREITDRKRAAALTAVETQVLELILADASLPETLTTLLGAVEQFLPDVSGTIRLLDPTSGQLGSIAAPTLPAEFVRRMTELTTIDDIKASLSITERSVIRDLEATGTRADITDLCLSYGLRGVWSVPIRSADGAAFLGLLGLYLHSVRDPEPGELALMERTRDLIALAVDRSEHTKQLGHLALHDTLTGLPNRALAQDRLEHALARLDDDAMLAVLFIDLDRFKLVNDSLGHETGDELLVAVTQRLRASVRRQDTIARFGGDEFVVLCEDLTDEHQAEELADRAAEAFTDPFVLEHAEVTVSASIGIAVTGHSSARATSLLRDADAAMYRAKRRGGARHALFDDAMHTQAVSRLLTERALRQALGRNELRVLFQPQFAVGSGERVASEALLRWEHPTRGLVAPNDFIKVAEETGVIVSIGEWVLQRVCEVARESRASGPGGGPLSISTNLSARQLQRPEFPAVVARALRDFHVDPETLCLEVAEGMLLDDLDTMTAALRALKDLGLRLAIDDFGTGGSSLTYLRRFPFDELKVDRMFISGLGQSAADDAIVAGTIDMAHALGMVVAAEGVETEEQLIRLRELGCDRAQGYHLAPPERLESPRLVLVEQRLA